MSRAETAKLAACVAANSRGNHGAEAGRRRHADMREAAGDDGGDREHHGDQQRQPVADRRDRCRRRIPRP